MVLLSVNCLHYRTIVMKTEYFCSFSGISFRAGAVENFTFSKANVVL